MPAYRNKTGPNRGKRFQGKGWRDPIGGSLYFQLKRASFSRGQEVFPRDTMARLIGSMTSEVRREYPQLDEGLYFAFFLRKKQLEYSDERAFRVFDGGETVYVKILDEEGTEWVQNYAPGEGEWTVKVRGRKPRLEDVRRTHGVVEAHRLGLLR